MEDLKKLIRRDQIVGLSANSPLLEKSENETGFEKSLNRDIPPQTGTSPPTRVYISHLLLSRQCSATVLPILKPLIIETNPVLRVIDRTSTRVWQKQPDPLALGFYDRENRESL